MTAIVVQADARVLPLPDNSVDLIVTSPPYFALRSYTDGGEHYADQIGSEATPAEYIAALIACTREWMRVLKPTGSIFVNLGDKYNSAASGQNGSHPELLRDARKDRVMERGTTTRAVPVKSLMLLPQRYAIACVDQLGLTLRAELIWSKPSAMPESVTDRVRRSHEQWFHFTKMPRYFANIDDIRLEPSGYSRPSANRATPPGQRRRAMADTCNPLGSLPGSVWDIAAEPLRLPAELGIDHFAAFPTEWPRRLVKGWSPEAICNDCGYLIGGSHASGLLGVQHFVPSSAEESALLQEGLLGETHGPQQGLDPLPPADDPRVRRGLEAGPPDGAEDGIRVGAPAGHVGAPRQGSSGRRGGTPPQRGEDGQPDRELGTAYQVGPRPVAEAATEAVRVPALQWTHPDVRHSFACPHCDSDRLRPPVIVDPFGGTGTTALVASALGRVGITVDRSADYCRIAEWRTTDPAQRAKALGVEKPPVQLPGQEFLFNLAAA